MKTRAVLVCLFAFCLVTAVGVRWYAKRLLKTPPPTPPVQPQPPEPLPPDKTVGPEGVKLQPTPVGQVRLSDDAANKAGDFWLEQTLEFSAAAPADQDLVHLYASLDAEKMSGTRVRLKRNEVILEAAGPAADKEPRWAPVANAALPTLAAGRHQLGVLLRRGELSVWLGGRAILTCQPGKAPLGELELKGPSAAAVQAEGVRLGARRAIALGSIRFSDSFMRYTADGSWRPAGGSWELTALAFPERSANPFSLRASFGNDKPEDDRLYQGRLRHENYGLGIEISPFEGTLNIIRITGGSPAARAGLAEQDIFLQVDGVNVESFHVGQIYQMLVNGPNEEVRLRMLRPGEKKPREFRINRQQFRWGTPSEGTPLEPRLPPLETDGGQIALITSGDAGWGDYAAEVAVKPLGAGGVGLAIAVLSPQDYLLFRWRGPAGRRATAAGETLAPRPGAYDRLELVRVSGGKETVLAEKPGGYRPYEFYRLGVDWNGDQIKCSVDDNEIFKTTVPGLQRGQIGLYALSGDPVFFDDVHVYSDRSVVAGLHRPERAVNQIMAYEENMEVWANPALEWDRDLKTGWAVHKSRFPGEQTIVMKKPRFDTLQIGRGTTDSQASKPMLTFSPNKPGSGSPLLSGPGDATRWYRTGNTAIESLVIRANGEVYIDGRNETPNGFVVGLGWARTEGDRLAIRGLKNLGDPSTVHITSSNTLEYTFNDAPTDWQVACGRWGLLNKWICDPRWSWFGGRTKTLATIWNKYIFSGDISVDSYVALMMQKDDPPYERPGDYNITICGDGANLDSGYTLIFGGEDNSWTRLYRKGKLVAESNKEEHRVFSDRIRHPDKPDLHQRWFHLKLEKIGNKVSFYRDDALAFTFDDPEPLKEGRVGFWTLDNGFLLARVRIAHGGMRNAPFEPRKTARYEDTRVVNAYDSEVFTTVEPQMLPAAIRASLAAAPDAFRPADADAETSAAAPQDALPEAYRVVNGVGGGPFALQWRTLGIDLENNSVVRFAYRIEPGANVDLYLIDTSTRQASAEFNARQSGAYRWRLSGLRGSNEFAPLVGEVPGVKADGRWHSVQFDLQPSWQAFWHARGFKGGPAVAFKVMLGNVDNQDYLLAGMNGNHAGAAYSVSDITVRFPKDVDRQAPKVERVVWPYDGDGDGRSIVLNLRDPGGSGVNGNSLDVLLNDVSVPKDALEFDAWPAGALSADGSLLQQLKIDLAKLNQPPFTLNLKLLGFEDRAGNAAPAHTASVSYTAAQVLQAAKLVAAPEIDIREAGGPDFVSGSHALGMADVGPYGQRRLARLQESSDAPPWAPYGQKRSLQVVSTGDGSSFGFQLNGVSFDLRHWPYLQLDYKIPFETPINLHLIDRSGLMHALLLTDVGDALDPDSRNIASRCGPPADFVADGTWRQTTVPLHRLLEAAFPANLASEMQSLTIHDNGWRGNRRGMQYWIHRIQFVPAARTESLDFNWQASDPTGIKDYASCVDDRPLTDPHGRQDIAPNENLQVALTRRNAVLKDGWNYIHVRVKNNAGVWSDVAHRKFFLDNQPPKIVKTEPAAGGATAGQTLRIRVEDASSVDLRALSMLVNGRLITGYSEGVAYDHAARVITYNAAVSGATWPDGSEVGVEVRGLSDSLGNRLAEPYAFTFKVDRSLDRSGPAIARMCCISASQNTGQHRVMEMETSFGLNFEEHTGHVHALRDCRMDWLDDPAQAAFGQRAVKFTALDDDADVQVMLHKNPWYMDRLPVLQFDYKADPGFCADLLVEVLGDWYSIRFTGDGAAPTDGKAIGAIEAVVADGQWRHASVDLGTLIDAARPNLEVRIINKIMFSAQGRSGCKRGATLTIDNLDLTPAMGDGAAFEWEAAADPSGIAGYSFIVDQRPETAVPARIHYTSASAPVGGLVGVWYAHVRACDQAGNWGPIRNLRVDFGTPKRRMRDEPNWP